LQLAEQLAKFWEDRMPVESRMDARRQYLTEHNFAVYVKRLREILDLV
jgi:hypothetical protein